MHALSTLVLRHRLLVALAWLVVAVAGAATAPTTVDRLSFEFNLPGQAAYETNEKIIDRFGGGTGHGDDEPRKRHEQAVPQHQGGQSMHATTSGRDRQGV
jgi:hypothetical protein